MPSHTANPINTWRTWLPQVQTCNYRLHPSCSHFRHKLVPKLLWSDKACTYNRHADEPVLPTLMASQRYYHATGPSQSKRVSDFAKHAATAHEPNDNGPMLLRSPCEMPLQHLCCQTRQQPFGPAITSGTLIIQLKSLRSPAW